MFLAQKIGCAMRGNTMSCELCGGYTQAGGACWTKGCANYSSRVAPPVKEKQR
jgi:hypothetical protein